MRLIYKLYTKLSIGITYKSGIQQRHQDKICEWYMLFVRMIKWTIYKKLVVPVDGSKPADKALDHVIHLAKSISVNGSFGKIEIIIISVIPDLLLHLVLNLLGSLLEQESNFIFRIHYWDVWIEEIKYYQPPTCKKEEIWVRSN
jgi:hypothetical protein